MVKSGENKNLPYTGEYTAKLVSGYRIVIPPTFRKQLGNEFIITKGYEGSLVVVDKIRWERLIAPLREASFLNRNSRDTLRFLVASAYSIKADMQGRLVVPQALREYAGFTSLYVGKPTTIIGVYNWIEIWQTERWLQHKEYIETNADGIAQELVHLNKSD